MCSSDLGVCLAVFPELGLIGYSIDDLLLSDVLLRETLAAIETIRAASAGFLPAIVVGAPLRAGGRLFNFFSCGGVLWKDDLLS